jgi:hypothetical protein
MLCIAIGVIRGLQGEGNSLGQQILDDGRLRAFLSETCFMIPHSLMVTVMT